MLSWSANQVKEHDECDAALMRLWERQGIELRFSLEEEEEEMSTSASVLLKKKNRQQGSNWIKSHNGLDVIETLLFQTEQPLFSLLAHKALSYQTQGKNV